MISYDFVDLSIIIYTSIYCPLEIFHKSKKFFVSIYAVLQYINT